MGGYFLFGGRDTGNSTWLAEHCNGATWVDLLDPPTQREYLAGPERLRNLVRRLDDFCRFLEAVSFSHIQIFNMAAVARDCSATRNTVESYLTIPEDLLLASRLPVFSRRAKRATVAHSKFYFFDCGVYRSLRPAGPIDPREEIVGPALEGLVFQHLRAWIDYRGSDLRLHYWRTQGGSEVGFVLAAPVESFLEQLHPEAPLLDL